MAKRGVVFLSAIFMICYSRVAPVIKNPPASVGDSRDMGSIPGLGRSPGEENGNPLQWVLAWEIPWTEDLGGVAKSQTRLSMHEHIPDIQMAPSVLGSQHFSVSILLILGPESSLLWGCPTFWRMFTSIPVHASVHGVTRSGPLNNCSLHTQYL